MAEKRSTRRSGVFSRMLPGSCFARQSLRRSIMILAVCGGSSDLLERHRLSRVRTLRSLSTEKSEPFTPFLMNPRAPEVALRCLLVTGMFEEK